MTKKKETTTKTEAVEVDEATKQASGAKSNGVESIETTKTTKDTSEKKEALKTQENKSKEKKTPVVDEDSLNVLYCKPSSLSSAWLVVNEKVKVKDVKDRTYSHQAAQHDAEYLLEGGKIFSVKEGSVIAKDGSKELEILKSNK